MAGGKTSRFYARWIFRVPSLFCLLGGLVGTVSALVGPHGSRALAWSIFQLVFQPYMAAYGGWMTYCTWRYPVIRIADDAIEWRGILTFRWRHVPMADVVGLRWQDSFDLRFLTRAGEELSLHLSQISARDRRRLIPLLGEKLGRDARPTGAPAR